ncbi:MAG: hypothetical protein ABIW38_06750 [Ferruginibacter sp.]
MSQKEKEVTLNGSILLTFLLLNVIVLRHAFLNNQNWYWVLLILLPCLLIALSYTRQKKNW